MHTCTNMHEKRDQETTLLKLIHEGWIGSDHCSAGNTRQVSPAMHAVPRKWVVMGENEKEK